MLPEELEAAIDERLILTVDAVVVTPLNVTHQEEPPVSPTSEKVTLSVDVPAAGPRGPYSEGRKAHDMYRPERNSVSPPQ